jgi:hypothetical protein
MSNKVERRSTAYNRANRMATRFKVVPALSSMLRAQSVGSWAARNGPKILCTVPGMRFQQTCSLDCRNRAGRANQAPRYR